MHITCPSCSATFKVDADPLAKAARRVRCGRCGHVWQASPSGAGGMASRAETWPMRAEPDPYAPTPPPRGGTYGPAPYPQRRWRQGALLGGLLLVAVVAALLAAAWHFRAEIVAEVPETARIYRALRIPVEAGGEGLEISGVTSVRRTVAGERRMVVSGSVVNVSGTARAVPMLRAVVSDAAGQEVMSWEFAAAARRLDPGEVATFETSAANPPDDSALRVEFAGGG